MQKLTKAVITPLQGTHSLRMIVHFVILTQPSFGKISSYRHCSNSKCLWIANAYIKMLTTHTHTYIYVCVCVYSLHANQASQNHVVLILCLLSFGIFYVLIGKETANGGRKVNLLLHMLC